MKKGDLITNFRTGQRMTFLQTRIDSKGKLLQIECESPPTDKKEHLHIHPYQENRFSILSGELTFRINGKIRKAKQGELVSIPNNVPHEFWNEGNETARYIQEFAPALKMEELFETFFALSRDGKLDRRGRPNIFRLAVIMLSFQHEIRLAKPRWIIQKIFITLLSPIGRALGYSATYK